MKDYRRDWFPLEDVTFLNTAGQGPLPRVSVQAAQDAIQAKTFPHRFGDSTYLEAPNRARAAIAKLIGAAPDEIALTSGASAGAVAVANGLNWNPGDEVITAKGEFPLQYSTWTPLQEREGIVLKIVEPRGAFLVAEDLIAAMTPRTRLVSVSLVRFEDGSLLDARRVADACHAQGALLFLDGSQCCGALPLSVKDLGADFLTSAGYKWLLSPYGTGFFWMRLEALDLFRPGPFYWMAAEGAEDFSMLALSNPRPTRSARRWDAPEWSSYYNLNLAALAASTEFLVGAGPGVVFDHNRRLIDGMFRQLPKNLAPASPVDSSRRGPFGCIRAQTPEETAALYERLTRERVCVSLREGNIRVSPHLFNTFEDITRLIEVLEVKP
jgi:selenocysteine lyase/cysteine desulfurase